MVYLSILKSTNVILLPTFTSVRIDTVLTLSSSEFDVHSGTVIRCSHPAGRLEALSSSTSHFAGLADLMLPEGSHKRQWVSLSRSYTILIDEYSQ